MKAILKLQLSMLALIGFSTSFFSCSSDKDDAQPELKKVTYSRGYFPLTDGMVCDSTGDSRVGELYRFVQGQINRLNLNSDLSGTWEAEYRTDNGFQNQNNIALMPFDTARNALTGVLSTFNRKVQDYDFGQGDLKVSYYYKVTRDGQVMKSSDAVTFTYSQKNRYVFSNIDTIDISNQTYSSVIRSSVMVDIADLLTKYGGTSVENAEFFTYQPDHYMFSPQMNNNFISDIKFRDDGKAILVSFHINDDARKLFKQYSGVWYILCKCKIGDTSDINVKFPILVVIG